MHLEKSPFFLIQFFAAHMPMIWLKQGSQWTKYWFGGEFFFFLNKVLVSYMILMQ